MSSNQDVSEILESAALAQGVGDLQTALTQYESALRILIQSLKSKPKGSDEHNQLFQMINIYMNEAELIKKTLSSKDDLSPPSLPPPLPPTTSIPKTSQSSLKPSLKSKIPTTSSKVSNIPDNFDFSAPMKAKPKSSNFAAPTSSSNRRSVSPQPSGTKRALSPIPVSKPTEKVNEYESQILSEMLETSPGVRWGDIAGLAFAKQTLQEAVILPNLRPDLFVGLRSPPRGVLLFG